MGEFSISDAMGRPKQDLVDIPGRYPKGTRERIAAVLEKGEKQADFLRIAVESELKKREGRRKRGIKDGP
jgi:hypothetical protein